MKRLNNNVKSLFESQELKTIPQVIERFNERNKKLEQVFASEEIPKHLDGLTKHLALLKILSNNDLYAIMNIGYYNACLEDNALVFLDAFFTYSRLNFRKIKLLDSGVDHCGYFPSVVEHFAMNDFDNAKQIFNIELGMSSMGHTYAKCLTNLIMGMLHNKKIIIGNAVINADKYLSGKNPGFDNATIKFLLYVIKKDFFEANISFDKICTGYKKAKWIHEFKNPFLKEIAIFPIGLFKLAGHYLGSEIENLKLPENDILWNDFILLKARGKAFIMFEDKLSGLNDFLE